MSDKNNMNSQLVHTTFLQRENEFRHHSYDEEIKQYELLKEGNLECVEGSASIFSSDSTGHLSDNPLRNYQYLFVAAVTLATRFSIEGGLESEIAYNLSDLYIQKMDLCKTVSDIKALQKVMMKDFTKRVAKGKKEWAYSKPILLCKDYIYYHLHKTITVADLSVHVGLSQSYLSVLFKKETGQSVSEYIRQKRIEAAKNMLKFSEYSSLEIGNYLAFSNHSHFIYLFKKYTGYTPKVYRDKFFRRNLY